MIKSGVCFANFSIFDPRDGSDTDSLVCCIGNKQAHIFANFPCCLLILITLFTMTEMRTIMLSPCNVYPLTPHLYIVRMAFTGVYIISYFFSKT